MTTVKIDQTKNTVTAVDYVGDTVTVAASYKDSGGVLIDLTGYSAKMDIKTRGGTEVLLALTDSSGIVLGGTPNNITITITAAQSATLGAGTFASDLVLTTPLSTVNTLFSFNLTLRPRVTV